MFVMGLINIVVHLYLKLWWLKRLQLSKNKMIGKSNMGCVFSLVVPTDVEVYSGIT